MKKLISFISIILIFLLSGCSQSTKNVEDKPKDNIIQKEEKYISPYTGEQISKDTLNNIPFMVIVENSKDARPQSGLVDADIVYETMAEGGIPRFIALFHKNSPEKIGPVRSARPYFLDLSKLYKLPFGHCGYSEEAKNQIETENLPSLNEFIYEKYYWRDKSRKYEHSLYTSTANMRKLISEKNLIINPASIYNFDKSYWENSNLNSSNSVTIKVNKYYNTSYALKDSLYVKQMDGSASINRDDNRPIQAKNIVIQLTDITLQNDNLHVDIRLLGEGDCLVISNGKVVKGRWKQSSLDSNIELIDSLGNPIPLNTGNTWWHILDKKVPIEIK
ncbi:DUF3048 domain-containing protein [Clostridium peptidivorans]|uniref:DUF3048 domain-containing protein n=1 Tax=Clostridium peptidivorans TaxID=100174 RepID=UPI000BE341A5|nr:DUF3048 domain-containing protein [Clostridium peptidivorans]